MNPIIFQQIKQRGKLVSTPNEDGTQTDVYTLNIPNGDTVVYTHKTKIEEIQKEQEADQKLVDEAQARIEKRRTQLAQLVDISEKPVEEDLPVEEKIV